MTMAENDQYHCDPPKEIQFLDSLYPLFEEHVDLAYRGIAWAAVTEVKVLSAIL